MDLFPLINSIRISLISTAVVFLAGIFFAYYFSKLSRGIKGILDVILTLPLVLPPTVVGYLTLRLLGPKRPIGAFFMRVFSLNLTMNWYSSVFVTVIVIFPLMYRSARGAFENFDRNYSYAGQTLGMSNTRIFWRVILPSCRHGIISGAVLSFARALGEYGATSMISGYIPGKTATISTTVYQLWRIGDDTLAYKWVGLNLIISFLVLMCINMVEKKD